MASITFAVDPEFKSKISKFLWINWSELVRERLIEREKQAEFLLKKLSSKEEQELIKWSVELGRKAKKESFKNLLSKLPSKRRNELLEKIPLKKRKELLE